MKAGKLRTWVIFKSFTNIPNEDGTRNETYSPVCKVKANVLYLRGKGYFENYQYLYSVQGRAFIRYRTDIKNDYRIEIDGQDFEIDSIRPADIKKRELEVVFKAVEK